MFLHQTCVMELDLVKSVSAAAAAASILCLV